MNAFDELLNLLKRARDAASMETACLGFPNDRIEIKSLHFGVSSSGDLKTGDVLHPTEYVQRIVRLHHNSWVIGPLNRAIEILEGSSELLSESEKLAEQLRGVCTSIDRLSSMSKMIRP